VRFATALDSASSTFAIPIGIVAGLFLQSRSQSSRPAPHDSRDHDGSSLHPSRDLRLSDDRHRLRSVGIKLPGIGFSGIAGSFAIGVLMIPVIMKASETALRGVPSTIREAGLALGARRGVVARKVVIPTALPGLITAVLLALSRAVGETAPILWVIGASTMVELNPKKEMASMPLQIFQSATSPYVALREEAWGSRCSWSS